MLSIDRTHRPHKPNRSQDGRWDSVSAHNACPICSKHKLCRVARDGGSVICYGNRQPSVSSWTKSGERTDRNGLPYRVYHQRGIHSWLSRTEHAPPRDESPPDHPDVSHLAVEYEKNLTAEDAAALLQQLDLPGWAVEALREIGVGYIPARQWKRSAWTFRQRDCFGRTIGIARRHPSGAKSMVPGTHNGLVLPDGWKQRAMEAGYVLAVEGASDVAAGLAAELSVVGRSSNRGDVPYLRGLVAQLPVPVQLIMVGENDGPKSSNGIWPGRAGAIHTAAALARYTGHRIDWALPPKSCKDARDFLVRRAGPNGTRKKWRKAGTELLRHLRATAAPGDDADVRQLGNELASWLPNRKCLYPYTLSLGHKENDCHGCAVDACCRRWSCGGCFWKNLYQWVVGVGDRLQDYVDTTSHDDGPRSWPGDAGNLRDVGSWSLGAAFVTKKRLRSIARAKGLEYVAVRTSLEIEDAEAICKASFALNQIGGGSYLIKCETPDQNDRYLALIAVAPGEPFPRGFTRICQSEFLQLLVEAGREIPRSAPPLESISDDEADDESDSDGDRKKSRLRPILASSGLRPRKEVLPPGKWVREGQHDRPAEQIGEIVADLGIEKKATVNGPNIQGDAHGFEERRWFRWMLREITAPKSGERVLTNERVKTLLDSWSRHLPEEDTPEGPAVCHVLSLYSRTGPPSDIADQIREAVEDDRRTAPDRARRAESDRSADAALAEVVMILRNMREDYYTSRKHHDDPFYRELFGKPPKYLRRKLTPTLQAERAATPRWRRGDLTRSKKGSRTLAPILGGASR